MSLRDRLRSLPSIVGSSSPLDTTHEDPRTLFIQFVSEAIDAGIPEPHAITLVTVDGSGRPDARVLIIKDIDQDGNVAIATSSRSAKGRQLCGNPHVALSWYCTAHARAIRIRGTASLAPDDIASADFRARSRRAKAIAKAGTQSSPIPDNTDREAIIDKMESRLETSAESDCSDWQVWLIAPQEVEFWQGAKDRNHDRLKYERSAGGWRRMTLWP